MNYLTCPKWLLKALLSAFTGFFLYASSIAAQSGEGSVITGTVKSSDTGMPLSDVNVFLSRTNMGSATDRDGNYTIENVPDGVYELVFSYVGFQTRIIDMRLLGKDTYTYNVTLSPKSIQLDELSITGERDREWERNLDMFRREFVGTTVLAENTEIMNPEILVFEWDESGSILTARTEKELRIVNRGLGYEIYVVLSKFEYIARDRSRNLEDVVEYLIYPRYEELPDTNATLKKEWIENRREAYLGSMRHFLFSLYHDRVQDEDFEIGDGIIQRLDPSTEEYMLKYRPMDSAYKKGLKGYQFQANSSRTPLTITYQNRQTSYLIDTDNNVFFIDEFGKLLDVRSLVVGGVWHQTRLANELPQNYSLNGPE